MPKQAERALPANLSRESLSHLQKNKTRSYTIIIVALFILTLILILVEISCGVSGFKPLEKNSSFIRHWHSSKYKLSASYPHAARHVRGGFRSRTCHCGRSASKCTGKPFGIVINYRYFTRCSVWRNSGHFSNRAMAYALCAGSKS